MFGLYDSEYLLAGDCATALSPVLLTTLSLLIQRFNLIRFANILDLTALWLFTTPWLIVEHIECTFVFASHWARYLCTCPLNVLFPG